MTKKVTLAGLKRRIEKLESNEHSKRIREQSFSVRIETKSDWLTPAIGLMFIAKPSFGPAEEGRWAVKWSDKESPLEVAQKLKWLAEKLEEFDKSQRKR